MSQIHRYASFDGTIKRKGDKQKCQNHQKRSKASFHK